jgi:hypothetical protein
VGSGALGRTLLGGALQLQGMRPGEEQLTPAELLLASEGVPGVVLCWGGPEVVYLKVVRLLRAGQLQGWHVSAYMLARLAELTEQQAACALDEYAALLARPLADDNVCARFIGVVRQVARRAS